MAHDPLEGGVLAPQDAPSSSLPTSFAAASGGAFIEPWIRRVRDVDDDTLAGLLRTLVGLRQAVDRIGAYDPQRLDPASADGIEKLDRLQAGTACYVVVTPEASDDLPLTRILQLHVACELV